MQTKPNTHVVARLALAVSFVAALCPAQQQNVGAVGQGVSISFQNASGSTDRGVSVGFQDAAGTIQVSMNVAAAAFTIKGPATYTGTGLSFTKANAPAGSYTITYGVVPGYTTSLAETRVLSAGGTITFTGSYSPVPGFGRIQVTTNLDAASFTVVAVTDTPGFTSFTKTGKFYDTGVAVPAGTYRVTFAPVSGYFAPPAQTLSLGAGATLPFIGTYRRIIVALFTGFTDHPTPFPDDGVTYPDNCPQDNCPGMAQLAMQLRAVTVLRDGIITRTFTYYDVDDWLKWLGVSCVLWTNCAWNHVPSNDTTHLIAAAWLASEARPQPDDRIVVIGHSYGGNRARLFAEQLSTLGYTASLLITVDAVNWSTCSIADFVQGVVQGDNPCNQSGDADAKPRQASIGDVGAFTQADPATLSGNPVLAGYHFRNYSPNRVTYPTCSTGNALLQPVCSHAYISIDPAVHSSIIDRLVQLKNSSTEPIYDISVGSVGTTTTTITWKTGVTSLGGIRYSVNQDAAKNGIDVPESTVAGITHSATISNLAANTRYYFSVRTRIPDSTNFQTSSVRFFQTSQTAPVIRASIPALTRSGTALSLSVTLTNYGASAVNGSMTAASIGASKASLVFPQPIPDLATGTSFYPVIPFPASVGASGTTVYPILTVKYSGSTFSVAVPPVKIP